MMVKTGRIKNWKIVWSEQYKDYSRDQFNTDFEYNNANNEYGLVYENTYLKDMFNDSLKGPAASLNIERIESTVLDQYVVYVSSSVGSLVRKTILNKYALSYKEALRFGRSWMRNNPTAGLSPKLIANLKNVLITYKGYGENEKTIKPIIRGRVARKRISAINKGLKRISYREFK